MAKIKTVQSNSSTVHITLDNGHSISVNVSTLITVRHWDNQDDGPRNRVIIDPNHRNTRYCDTRTGLWYEADGTPVRKDLAQTHALGPAWFERIE